MKNLCRPVMVLSLVSVLTIFFLAAGGQAADPTSTLVAALQQNYAQLRSFQANFSQKLIHQESGSEEKRSGRILFQRPLNIRWETLDPDPELLVVTKKEIWNYLPEDNTATRYEPELAMDSRSIIQVVTGQSRLDQDFDVEQAGRDGNLIRLLLYPHDPTTQFTEGQIWIDPETKFIRRVAITDFYGNINDITLTDMSVNLNLAKDNFLFTPPAGTEIVDRMDADTSGTTLLQ